MSRVPFLAFPLFILLAGVRLPSQSPPAPFVSHGVSHELATLRSQTISDVRYNLRLDVTAPDSALGRVQIQFRRAGHDDAIVDFRGRRLTKIVANGIPLALDVFNGAHIRVPAQLLRDGKNSIDAEFVADIAASGTSIIKTHDASDGNDYLYTLLVPADANQLFPCFDQPDLKARVSFSLTASRTWTVLANGSVASADTSGDRVTTRFTETRPLSTYLIAFAAGPWQRATSVANGRSISVYARRSRAKEADLDSLLALNHRAISWMEQYFGRPYPFEKFDFLLAPAFPFGGMEHPGAVFYNEDRFIFRERPTLPRRLGRFSTILHEVAHQWFGDLVTMKWFDDLWLKEGFATYMAAKALNDLEPASDAWKSFHLGNKPVAYGVDQTTGTTPLWQELDNLDQAKSAYGAIVYNKAPSVLKQLNYLVGEPAFRSGVQQFLAAHAYANATWQDLLASISAASGTPLDAFGKNYMLRPGMPRVETQVTLRDGKIDRLLLVQTPAQNLSGSAAWPLKTQVLFAYRNQKPITMVVGLTNSITDIVAARGLPAPTFVFPNFEDYGYFLTRLDSASVRSLASGEIGRVRDSFLRAMLWSALWDQVRDARMDPAQFAKLVLAELPEETDEQLAPILLSRLDRTTRAYLSDIDRERMRKDAERVLWNGAHDTRKPYGIRKGFLDTFIQLATTVEGLSIVRSLLSVDSIAGEPLRDPTRWEIVNRLLVVGTSDAESALSTQARRDTTPDGRRRAFIAGAARRSATTKSDYFSRYFADQNLNEDWASGSLATFNAVEHQDLTLPFLRAALDSLPYIQANRRIFFLGSWLGAFLGGQGSDEALQVVRRFLAEHPALPKDLRQKVLQNADELERTVRIHAHERH